MRRILETCFGTDDKLVDGVEFPVCLLHVWTKALSSHGTDALRKQRFSDEVVIQNVIGSISSNPRDLLKTWYDLLVDEEQTCSAILPHILSGLESVPREKIQKQLDTTLFMIYTGQLPWASSVPLYTDMTFPPTQLSRRLPVLNWVQALKRHRQKDFILEQIAAFKGKSPFRVLFQNKPTEEEEEELKQTGSTYPADLASPEDMMYRALLVFDKVLDDAVYDEESPISAEDMAEWIVNIIYKDLKDSNVHFNLEYFKVFGNLTKPKILRQMLSPILRLIACATLGLEWEEEWSPQLIKAKDYLRANEWKHVSSICLRNPPYYDGDRTNLWSLRLRLWTLFDGEIAHGSLHGLLGNLNNLKQVEQDLQSTRLLGTSKAGDLLLVLFHLNVAYSWGFLTISALYAVIPDTLIGDTTKIDAGGVSKECIEYLSVICEEISADPSRLIRLLIELVRADIGFHCTIRRPKILFDLLKHAKTHLSDKELRPFIPSCQRLRQYIKKSYGQYEKDWDAVPPQAYVDENPQTYYAVVDRAELKTLYGEVLTLLKPAGQWEGEVKNVAWPRELLRPIGGRKTGDSLVEPGFEELDTPDGEDNVVLAVVEEAVE
ncbi:hypothetical protein FRC17_006059 [Serendipita sp. 399]|nr:hypothetical protein FRC17_006059 [Serendipita sp. 399]